MTQTPQANAVLRTCSPGIPFRNWNTRLATESNLICDNAA